MIISHFRPKSSLLVSMGKSHQKLAIFGDRSDVSFVRRDRVTGYRPDPIIPRRPGSFVLSHQM
jgi:hypothetical protein